MIRHGDELAIEQACAFAGTGLSQRRIAHRLGVSQSCVSRWLKRGTAPGGEPQPAPAPVPLHPTGARLIERLWRATDREVALIERAQLDPERPAGAADLDRRALATLVGLTRDLIDLVPPAPAGDGVSGRGRWVPAPSAEDESALREALMRKLDGLRDEYLASQEAEGDGASEATGVRW